MVKKKVGMKSLLLSCVAVGALALPGAALAETVTATGSSDVLAVQSSDVLASEESMPAIRVSGEDRYATMNEVVTNSFRTDSVDTVYITSGENFPDALAASGIAGQSGAPVLTTATDSLSESTANALVWLNSVENAVILGGENVVSDNVATQLEDRGINVSRIAGTDRFDTAHEMYMAGTNWSNFAFVVSGQTPTDALSISPLAWALGAPVFLTDAQGNLTEDEAADIANGDFLAVIIAGGTNVVSEETQTDLNAILGEDTVLRLAGADRYETSATIVKFAQLSGLASNKMYYVNGEDGANGSVNFADALATGPVAGHDGIPMMIIGDNQTSRDIIMSFPVDRAFIIGGSNVVSEELATFINENM